MACIRKRRGKYVVDYRDGAGIRRWVTCDTRRQAQDVLSEKLRESRQASRPAVDPNITVSAYLKRWETLIASGVKSRTLADYKDTFRLHLIPALGPMRIRQLHRGRIKALLAEKLSFGLARNSVRIIHATLRAMLNAAIDDGVILSNPAERLGRQLRLVTRAGERQEAIKAFTREQLAHLLGTAAKEERQWAPLFFTMARAGLRLGEALALQWEDLHFRAREIRVARGFSRGRLDTPKSRHGRTVDMSQQLARALLRLQIERKTETLRRGWPALPP
jgi:integrase